MEYNQISAGILFTASTVLIGISIVLIKSVWASLKEIITVLPEEKRHIYCLLRLRDISDRRERCIEFNKCLLWISAFILAINIFVDILALIGIAALFMGINTGFEEIKMSNFDFARCMLFVSPILLTIAFLCIGVYRFDEFTAIKAGRVDPHRYIYALKNIEVEKRDNANKKTRKARKEN
jgi:hypothetical protein